MTKQVMSILSATDKKIKTLFPDKVAARKLQDEADKALLDAAAAPSTGEVHETAPVKPEAAPLKLNRKIRRHFKRMSRKMRKNEVREANEKKYAERLEREAMDAAIAEGIQEGSTEQILEQMEATNNEQD